jgi:hypothetical protein
MPVVLGADDPATLGYNEFTLDWYEAFMAWGLYLGEFEEFVGFVYVNYKSTCAHIQNFHKLIRCQIDK